MKEKGFKVAIVMGSKSDLDVMKSAAKTLEEFGVDYEMRIMSAHRTPDEVTEYSRTAASRGIRVIIAGAGAAAHLAGVIAANTVLPVIGVPLAGGPLGGVEALYSTVMMPSGIPVATVAVGGSTNAALLALQILSIDDEDLKYKLLEHRARMKEKVMKADAEVSER